MPISDLHPEYVAHQDDWITLRDAFAGSKAIRRQRERYTPRPGGMTEQQYAAYLARGEWMNATARTVRGLAGEVFRKPLTLTGLDSALMTRWQKDVSGQGLPLQAFAATVVEQVLQMGHYGVLLDVRPTPDGRIVPVWAGFPIEQVRNWEFTETPAGWQLSRLILDERTWQCPSVDDPWRREEVCRYRVLTLTPEGYQSQRFEQVHGEWVEVAAPPPALRRGAPLSFIPFVLFGPHSLEWCLQDSLLLPLVHINLRHWRHSCDYEHSLHLICSPTLVVTGHNTAYDVAGDGHAEVRIVLGSQGGICLPEAEAKAYILAVPEGGMQPMERAIEADKKDMAVLGARLLEEAPQVEEREVAIRQRHGAETSALRQVADAVSLGLTQLAQWSAWWVGEVEDPQGDDVQVQLNRDYLTARLSAQDLVALLQVQQAGGISRQTFFHNLAMGEITEPGLTWEEEEARLAAQPPVTLSLADPGGGGEEEDETGRREAEEGR
jgi:hypothetical protein